MLKIIFDISTLFLCQNVLFLLLSQQLQHYLCSYGSSESFCTSNVSKFRENFFTVSNYHFLDILIPRCLPFLYTYMLYHIILNCRLHMFSRCNLCSQDNYNSIIRVTYMHKRTLARRNTLLLWGQWISESEIGNRKWEIIAA